MELARGGVIVLGVEEAGELRRGVEDVDVGGEEAGGGGTD